jgi:hypothetical protein
MKVETETGIEGRPPRIVHLEGEEFGFWSGLRSDAVAIDLSGQLEIHVTDLRPGALTEPEQVGFIYAHKDGAFFPCAGRGTKVGYVCVRECKLHSLGKLFFAIDAADLCEIGKAILVAPEVKFAVVGGRH